MAFITEFTPASGDRGRRHSSCSAGWRVSEHDGVRVLQIDTYGSSERQDQGTISQSLQLDETRSADLLSVIRQVFPNLI